MRNKKGFVLTETLVIIVFLVTIFTFIYVSAIPLMGKYEDMTRRLSDIDIVYKLYHVRKMIKNDSNKTSILNQPFKEIKCEDLANETYCNKLMEYLELDNYILVYADRINTRLSNFRGLTRDTSKEMSDYVSKYQNYDENVLVLLDLNKHVVAHLMIDGISSNG